MKFTLQPISDLIKINNNNRWLATGINPQFRLIPQLNNFPTGWILLQSNLIRYATDYSAYLLFELNNNQSLKIPIPVTLKGKIHELIFFPDEIKTIRWLPMNSKGDIEQAPLIYKTVNFFEYYYQIWRRIILLLWFNQRHQPFKSLGINLKQLYYDLPSVYSTTGFLYAYAPKIEYNIWLERFEKISNSEIAYINNQIKLLTQHPLISVIIINNNVEQLIASVTSINKQLYQHWELLIINLTQDNLILYQNYLILEKITTAARQPIIINVVNLSLADALNQALAKIKGEYFACINSGDILAISALYQVALAVNKTQLVLAVYSDEDYINIDGSRHSPQFKPAWSPDLFFSRNYLSQLLILSVQFTRAAAGFINDREGAEFYDLILRCLKRNPNLNIIHIPALLCQRRVQPKISNDETSSEIKALENYFSGTANIQIKHGLISKTFHVFYPLPDTPPKITLIIPTKNNFNLLKNCIESIFKYTDYKNFEILIINNHSDEINTVQYLAQLANHAAIKILSYPDPFNYAAINNFAVKHAAGELICLINDDVEVIHSEWLTEMARHALRLEIGAVGAKLYYKDERIQHAGVVIGLGGVADHIHQFFERNAHGYCARLMVTQNFSAVTAACLLLRRAIFAEVGGFDEQNLKIAYNDVDLCLKIRAAGYRIVWTPYAELYHHESASRGKNQHAYRQRYQAEANYMRQRWKNILFNDPYYSPWLTLKRKECSIAEIPTLKKHWLAEGRMNK